jgi:hypothetical protein
MLGNHRIIVDEWAEVWDLLKPYADSSFWRWSDLELDPDAVYIVGRVVLKENWQSITEWAHCHPGKIVFCNPAEGSQTILLQLKRLMIFEKIKSGEILLLTSGDQEPGWNYCKTDCYFSNIVEYLENISAHESWPQVYHKKNKPYDFLFLNGRLRPHRKYLIDLLRQQNLLDRALWTNLSDSVEMSWTSTLITNQDEPVKLLPEHYEIPRAIPNMSELPAGFVKHHLFGNTWGDAIVNPAAYVDTSFSLVTETIFDYPHTFRTEKIWKPMIMCHPFVVAANPGYYRDLHNAGFETFGNLIDESFDQIDDPTDRANRVVAVVKDICYNGAEAFLQAARSACKYNYQQLRDHNTQQRAALPDSLEIYINANTHHSQNFSHQVGVR